MSKHRRRYEKVTQPVLKRPAFARRVVRNFLIASAMIGISLFAGMLGFRYLEDKEWIDAFANASMLLSGMGPLEPAKNWWGKFFSGWYALYSGLLLILASGVLLAPFVHRMLHRLHCDVEEEGK
ncbi:MAG TPA: hypothetical protein PLN21_21505 [Gemmatales bacterium]|nr:hypothetical protein [Gemmatales bacterium]